MHLAIIGYGSIGQSLVAMLRQQNGPSEVTVLVRPGSAEPEGVQTVHDAPALIAARPTLVVECAGHAAVQDHVTAVLRAGIETVIVSVGALADEGLHVSVIEAARAGGTRVILPAGAIGGVDLLSALRLSGDMRVRYTSRKPPAAWLGTPAETLLDLATLSEAATFFEGNARQAASQYPKNANVAATLALAGAGFEATQVRMIADPGVTHNIHEYTVGAGAADYTMRIEGKPSAANAKTSATTALSVAREVLNRVGEVAI